jgi:hypothetical protein
MNGLLALTNNNVPIAGSKAFVQSTFSRTDGTQVVTQQVAGNAVNYNLDVMTQLTPWLANVSFDLATATVAPVVEGTFTDLDLYAAAVQFSAARRPSAGSCSPRRP